MSYSKRTEGPRDLGFVLALASGNRSLDTVTIESGSGVLLPGTILGQITANSKHIISPHAEVVGKEGAETGVAVLAYRVDATDADVDAVVVANDAELKEPELVVDASVDDATKRAAKVAQLRTVGIKAR